MQISVRPWSCHDSCNCSQSRRPTKKYFVIVGAVIGIGLFYKSAVHEIHIASGLGFGLPHPPHIEIGAILITISVAALVILTLLYNKSSQKDYRIK